jgi:cytochrome c556
MKSMKKLSALQTVATFALTVAAIAFSAPASAQFQKPEDAAKHHQSVMTVMGNHFGRSGAMVNVGATGGSCKNCHDSFQVKAN